MKGLLDMLGDGQLPEVTAKVELTEKTFFLMFAYGIMITAAICFTIQICKGLSLLFKK